MKAIKTIFIGTTYEGIPVLRALKTNPQFEVAAVITQPDRPIGRRQIKVPTVIKVEAKQQSIEVFHTENDEKKYTKIIDEIKPELIIVIAFGEIIPVSVLNYPKYKCINIHYSLLPQLRGAVPVQMAILQGLKKTGVTVQIMAKDLDVGPVLAQKDVNIAEKETTPSLKEKLIPMASDLLMQILPEWIEGKVKTQEQDDSKATYCWQSDISKDKALIDWQTMEPEYIERMVRALLPWPIAWTTLPQCKRLKIFEAKLDKFQKKDWIPGEILTANNQLLFATKTPGVVINAINVQLEGKRLMTAAEFLQGNRSLVQ